MEPHKEECHLSMGQGCWKISQQHTAFTNNTTHHNIFWPSQNNEADCWWIQEDWSRQHPDAIWSNTGQISSYSIQQLPIHTTRAEVLTSRNQECYSGVWSNPKSHLPPGSAQVQHFNWPQIPYTVLQDVQNRSTRQDTQKQTTSPRIPLKDDIWAGGNKHC